MNYFDGEEIAFSVLVVDQYHKQGLRRLFSTTRKCLNNVGFSGKNSRNYNSHNTVRYRNKIHNVINHPYYGASIVVEL